MSTSTTNGSTYGRYIGRVGALAAALGIGVMVLTSPGVASAEPSSSSSSSDANSSNDGSAKDSAAGGSQSPPSESTGPTDNEHATESTTKGSPSSGSTAGDSTPSTSSTQSSGATASSTEVAPGVTVGSSGGAHTSSPTGEQPASTVDPKATEVVTPPASSTPITPEDQDADTSAVTDSTDSSPAVETTTPASGHAAEKSSPAVDHLVSIESSTPTTLPVAKAANDEPSAAQGKSAATPTLMRALVVQSPSTSIAAALAPVEPTAAVTTPVVGIVAFFNDVVTKLLNPYLAPTPSTPNPFTPVVWAVLGWVRRQFFNQAPSVAYDQTLTSQDGQTVTGNIGASDPEGDTLTYTVAQGPEHGTLEIDQATGNFTYTPNDIDYEAVQTDSFTVTVTDGKTNLLSYLGVPHSAVQEIGVAVKPPTAERVIVPLPPGFTNAQIPRFAADGNSLLFSATPPGAATGARKEIYQVNVDGTDLTCVTCGLVDPTPLRAGTTAPRDLFKPVPFEDGSGRILMQSVDPATGAYTHVVYEPDTGQLVRIITPPGKAGVITTDPQREMRISPDGTRVLFSQIQLVPNPSDSPGFITAVPIVGMLTPGVDANGNKVYNITDARVVYPVGEGKQWTHDGKGVIIQGGLYDSGNVDDVVVDIATGQVTRLTGNLDYDEDVDLSPNNQWLAIDSARDLDALTPVSRIVRPAFVPLLIQGSVYTAYAGNSNATNVSNQPWLVAVEDDLNREDGIPLFVSDDPGTPEDEGDGWTARSMPSWNADGTAVAFWEANAAGESRLVVANLEYTTSVGAAEDKTTPAMSSSFPTLASNVPQQVKLIPPGTYAGAGGGTAVVTETTTSAGHVIRTVQYTDYVNDDGMVLNGSESTDQSAAQNTIHYIADIHVTGTHTGSLTGDATINKVTRTITATTPGSEIQSTLDGDTLVLLDPTRIAAARAGV